MKRKVLKMFSKCANVFTASKENMGNGKRGPSNEKFSSKDILLMRFETSLFQTMQTLIISIDGDKAAAGWEASKLMISHASSTSSSACCGPR